jgi:hypothetical protein
MQALGSVAAPRLDRSEIVELRDASAWRGHPTAGPGGIDFFAVQDISQNHPMTPEITIQHHSAKPLQTGGIVNLIAIDGKHPGVRTGVGFQKIMGLAGVRNRVEAHFISVTGVNFLKDRRCSVRGSIVHQKHLVASREGVFNSLPHEAILVFHENNANNARHFLFCNSTQSH